MSFEIIPFKINYFADTDNEVTEDISKKQKECLDNIINSIQKGICVDVGEYVDYLYVYLDCIFGNCFKCYRRGNAFSSDMLVEARNIISLYKDKYANIVQAAYLATICWEVFFSVDKDIIKQDLSDFIDYCKDHPLSQQKRKRWACEGIIASLYIYLYDITPEKEIPDSLFDVLCVNYIYQYITDVGISMKDNIIAISKKLVAEDFKECHINLIYRIYDLKEGSLITNTSVPASFYYELKKISDAPDGPRDKNSTSKITYRQRQETLGRAYCDVLFVPDNLGTDKKRENYLSIIVREAENICRTEKGLPKVNEGWTSETILYHKLKSAFKKEIVKSHFSPPFLGRQHYDVYFPEYKIAIEYQGEQHYTAIDIFGGEQGLKNTQKRDERKKTVSEKNDVHLIEVFPNYDIKDVIRQICEIIYDKNDSNRFKKAYDEAVILSDIMVSAPSDSAKQVPSQSIKMVLESADTEAEIERKKMQIAEELTKELIAQLTPSDYADEHLSWHDKQFFVDQYKYHEADRIKKTDPDRALQLCLELINHGHYKAPVVFERAAIILRKQKRTAEELQLLLQMKRDLGINNFDERIKKLVLMEYEKEIRKRL